MEKSTVSVRIHLSKKFQDMTAQNMASIDAEVLNFDGGHASLRIPNRDRRALQPGQVLDFILGRETIKKSIPYRVVWDLLEHDGTMGIEFTDSVREIIERANRYPVIAQSPMTLSVRDPNRPSEMIKFQVVDFSESGMKLARPRDQAHFFPGMFLKAAHFQVLNEEPVTLDFSISRAKLHESERVLELGVNVKGNLPLYQAAVKNYIKAVLPLAKPLRKKLREQITFKRYSDETLARVTTAIYAGKKLIGTYDIINSALPNTVEISNPVIQSKFFHSDFIAGILLALHSKLMTEGQPDLLFECPDTLRPLADLLGARLIPAADTVHPKALLTSDQYCEGEFANPYKWTLLYYRIAEILKALHLPSQQEKPKRKRTFPIAKMRFLLYAASILSISGGLAFLPILLVELLVQLKRAKNISIQFKKFKKHSQIQLEQLARSREVLNLQYREAKLLEQTSQQIQTSLDLKATLDHTLKILRENFGFGRAFIMLASDKRTTLKTYAISGMTEEAQGLWTFEINLKKRADQSLIFSNVYLTGNPILLNNAEEHLNFYSAASQRLIQRLEMQSFSIVPIPGRTGPWGILVADKYLRTEALTHRDLVLLQRVAQHLGIALDHHSQIEQERKLSLLFKKYVPNPVLSEAHEIEDAQLGGQQREVGCMFVDIRDFTGLSQSYAPEVILDILNDFYNRLYTSVTPSGGLIDKFQGDGVFVTWGSYGNSKPQSNQMVHVALQLLKERDALNMKLRSRGLPQLSIGIGIHQGKAIVGHVGAQERFDYTVIGSTVNLASRLQGLCKEFETPLVISREVYEAIDVGQWVLRDNVAVRGWKNGISIATLKDGQAIV